MADEEILKQLKLEFHPICISDANPGLPPGVEWMPPGTDVQVVQDSKCKGAILSGHVHAYTASGQGHGYEAYVIACVRRSK
jgi:hypothetical protein